MTIKAYSYARWSSDAQTDGDSERRQLEAASEYALRRGFDLDATHVDRGLSGYRGRHRRGALGRFLSSVREGSIRPGSVLIIESIDRLSREPVLDAFDLFSELLKTVEIVTLFDNQSYTRENITRDFGKLIVPLTKMMLAFEESEKKSIRRREYLDAKRRSGGVISATCPGWLEYCPATDGFKLREPFAGIVKQIFNDLRLFGKSAICNRLNSSQTPTLSTGRRKKTSTWHPSMVQKLVSDRRVLGEFQPHALGDDGKKVPSGPVRHGYYPAVVEDAAFYLARAAITARSKEASGGRKGSSLNNILSGIALCEVCGARMVYRNKGADLGRLACGAAIRSAGCDHRRHHAYSRVEDAILMSIVEVDLNTDQPHEGVCQNEGALTIAEGERTYLKQRLARIAKLLIDEGDDKISCERGQRAEPR